VLGHFSDSVKWTDASGATLVPANGGAAALSLIMNAFPLATTPDYVPACTDCSTNPISSSTLAANDVWDSMVLLSSIPTSAVSSTSRTHMDSVVDVSGGAGGAAGAAGAAGGSGAAGGPTLVPLSTHYGFRSVIAVP
jgi:hypothetical protein